MFKSEILEFPSYSQNLLWIYHQKTWSKVIKIKTAQFHEDILNSIPFVLKEHSHQQGLSLAFAFNYAGGIQKRMSVIYSKLDSRIWFSHKKEWSTDTTTWMNLNMLSEGSQTQKVT